MTATKLHPVSDPGIEWHGGIGHALLSTDPQESGGPSGVQCYRCGMAAEPDAWQELIPDCYGPDVTGHHWQASETVEYGKRKPSIECAYSDGSVTDLGEDSGARGACSRA